MVDIDEVDERLRAVERTLTDDGQDGAVPADTANLAARLDTVEERVEHLTEQVDELAASTQAVRGYVGNVRSVNEEIERRADAALATVEALEERLDERGKAQAQARHNETSGERPDGGAAAEQPTDERGVAGRTARRVMDDAAARADHDAPGEPASERPTRQRRRGRRPRDGEPAETEPSEDGFLASLRETL